MKKSISLNSSVSRKNKNIGFFPIFVAALLIVISIVLFAFLLWSLRFSLYNRDFDYSMYYGVKWTPDALLKDWDFTNFIRAFVQLKAQTHFTKEVKTIYLYNAYLYGLLYAGGSAFCQTFCTAIVAYLTAKYDNPFSKFFHKAVLFTLILPIAGNIVSQLDMARTLHLWNNLPGAWIQKFGFTNMYYLVFYAAYKRLSWEYAESAFIDGAGHFKVCFRIMFPLSFGLFGTVLLLYFISLWNDYQFPMMFLPDQMTPSVLLYNVMTNYSMNKPPLMCMCAVLVCLPILIVFLIFREKVMCNLTEGGIKE